MKARFCNWANFTGGSSTTGFT